MKVQGEWKDHMMWCPSQCYLPIEKDGEEFELYLRWRHDDPWQCHVLKKEESEVCWWSPDLFIIGIKFFKQNDDLEEIKKAAIKQAEIFLADPPDKRVWT